MYIIPFPSLIDTYDNLDVCFDILEEEKICYFYYLIIKLCNLKPKFFLAMRDWVNDFIADNSECKLSQYFRSMIEVFLNQQR